MLPMLFNNENRNHNRNLCHVRDANTHIHVNLKPDSNPYAFDEDPTTGPIDTNTVSTEYITDAGHHWGVYDWNHYWENYTWEQPLDKPVLEEHKLTKWLLYITQPLVNTNIVAPSHSPSHSPRDHQPNVKCMRRIDRKQSHNRKRHAVY